MARDAHEDKIVVMRRIPPAHIARRWGNRRLMGHSSRVTSTVVGENLTSDHYLRQVDLAMAPTDG